MSIDICSALTQFKWHVQSRSVSQVLLNDPCFEKWLDLLFKNGKIRVYQKQLVFSLIFDIFHSLSTLIHMICYGSDLPETGAFLVFKCSLVKCICKMNSYILKLNINCINKIFCISVARQRFSECREVRALTYFI